MRDGVKFQVFPTPEALGAYTAEIVRSELQQAIAARGRAALGCPSGRTPRPTYAALAQLLRTKPIDGCHLHLLMMDEFLEGEDGHWRHCPETAHFSCVGFAERYIRGAFNSALDQPIPRAKLHAPPADDPIAYEKLIADFGGIDVFLLASGESDGHVAFNPPGTSQNARTRRVELALATRQDNMRTFPAFQDISEVPRFGVSVGPATIAEHSRKAIMILTGAAKGHALRRMLDANAYDPSWPSTIIHACRNAEILADEAAVAAMKEL
jgi:glucosamine-6-phosphate deaminase